MSHRWGGVERPGRDPLTDAHMSRWVLFRDLRTVSKTSLTPELTLHIYLCSIRATAASKAAAGASGPCAVPQAAAQLGARRGRLLSRPLLHPTDTGATQRRLAHSFFCYKPQLYLLGSEQVSSFAISQPHNPTNNSTRGFTQRMASNDPHRVDFTLRCFETTCVPCRAHEGRTIRAVWRECY